MMINKLSYRVLWVILSVLLCFASMYVIMSVRETKTYDVDFAAIKQTTDDDGTQHLLLRGISLRKGIYTVNIGYEADSQVNIEISLDNDTYLTEELEGTSEGSGSRAYTFEIKNGTDKGRIDFTYPKGSELKLAYITISSDKPLFNDGLIWGTCLILMIPLIWIGLYQFLKSTHKMALLITISVVLIQIAPFFLKHGLHMGIDTRAHMMRIEGIYYGLLDGQFPVVVNPEWNNSYGQIGVLYPNLFLYIPALLRLIGMSQLGTFKLFVTLIVIASAAIAYGCCRLVFKKEWQICLAVVMICLDDMRLYNMLGDGRFGGALLAEMFYPLVVVGLIDVFYRDGRKWYLLAYGVAGVFCCHIMSATLVCFAVFLFAACSIKKLNKDVWYSIGKTVVLFAGLVVGTMTPFLKFYFSDWGQEKLQWEDYVTTLFPRGYAPDDIRWIYVITLLVICLASAVFLSFRHNYLRMSNSYIGGALVCAIVLLWMSTVIFPWKYLTNIASIKYYTNMIQDAYRFLSLVGCFLTFCVPEVLDRVISNQGIEVWYKSKAVITVCSVITVLCISNYILPNYDYFQRNSMILYHDEVIGEVEYQLDDYLPAGTQSDWYLTDTGFISDEEAVNSLDYERSGTHVRYSYTNNKDGAYAEFPKFYYDGYVAVDETGNLIEVVKGERNRTRVYLKTTDTQGIVDMRYRPRAYMTVLFVLSLVLWVVSPVIWNLKAFRYE